MTRPPLPAAVALLVTAALVATACGLGDKSQIADRIIDSVDRVRDAGTATGAMYVAARTKKLPPGGPTREMAQVATGVQPDPFAFGPELAFPIAIDFAVGRATLSFGDAPLEVFDGFNLYAKRRDAVPNDARPWIKVDLTDLESSGEVDYRDLPAGVMVYAFSPLVLVDLIAGALTGSVERVGTETIEGVTVTGYRANLDVEKTMRKTRRKSYDEDRREAIDDIRHVLRVIGDVHSGEVWLDDEGRPRRAVVNIAIEPQKSVELEVRLRLELTNLGAPVSIAVPTASERLEASSLLTYLGLMVPAAPPGASAEVPT